MSDKKESFDDMMKRLQKKMDEKKGTVAVPVAAPEEEKKAVAPEVKTEPAKKLSLKEIMAGKKVSSEAASKATVAVEELIAKSVEVTSEKKPEIAKEVPTEKKPDVPSEGLSKPVEKKVPVVTSPIGRPIKMSVGRVYKDKTTGGDLETIDVPVFIGPVATVSVGMSHTINLGDYQSAKVDVFMSVPCYVGEEYAAYDYAKEFVCAKLASEVAEIKEVIKK